MEEFLNMLNPEQRQAVVHEGGNLLILAGAGSGKTRVITTKIAWLINQKGTDPYNILAVTFTKKAANEMKERAVLMEPSSEKAQIKTFHSFGAWFLRRYYDAAGLEKNFTVYDDDDSVTLLRKACPELSAKDAKKAAHDIALAKDYFLSPEDDLSSVGSDFDLEPIYKAYQTRLLSTGNADFGDLIMIPVKVMQTNQSIRDYIHRRFRVIMVDEYQDANIAQFKLLQCLSGVNENDGMGVGTYTCVVGDDDQSIYAFRGAEVQNILNFPKEFPNTEIVRLQTNYRSVSNILNAASLVVKNNSSRLGKELVSARGEGKEPVLAFLQTQDSESEFVADLISKSVSLGHTKYSDWAVTYRMNAQSNGFESVFLKRKIPYKVVGSLKFYERQEIKDAVAYISVVANPKDEISFRRIVNFPVRGIGEKTQDRIVDFARDCDSEYRMTLLMACEHLEPELPKKAREGCEKFVSLIHSLEQCLTSGENLSEFMKRVVEYSGLEDFYKTEEDGTQRLANLQELVNTASLYENSFDGLNAFLDAINLDRSLEEQEQGGSDFVTLITLHNTKGLEFPCVVMSGLEEGVFPRQDKMGSELEEERRLCYVGITRAMNELYITCCGQRRMYGHTEFMRPSPFLYEARPALKIIGNLPYAFREKSNGTLSKSNASDVSKWGTKADIAAVWKKGTKLYNDDFGYGIIADCRLNEGEFVIKVQFETGAYKTYLPEYQSKALQIIKE
ncbi:MAG: UvrD-helicase domain-containing protein [Treponema sp.]|nr:UvrD-helicase domain-containing protein [Treponema sp.]